MKIDEDPLEDCVSRLNVIIRCYIMLVGYMT